MAAFSTTVSNSSLPMEAITVFSKTSSNSPLVDKVPD